LPETGKQQFQKLVANKGQALST